MSETFTRKVALYFQARPNVWIDGVELEKVGGRYGWRSRVSNCRTELGMVIENRVRSVKGVGGRTAYKVSEYRFVPGGQQRLDLSA